MSKSIDHRQIADEMEIYFLNENIGAGLPVWLPNGVAIRDALESYMRKLERGAGYQRVVSPHLAKEKLYSMSGHLDFYRDDMFPALDDGDPQNRLYLKPMNCPHHHMVFASSPKSYRQLPLRVAEYGQVYRNESSGALKGLSRVRGLCQNDAHIYLAPEDCLEECRRVLQMQEHCYRALGLKGYRYRLSLSDSERPDDFHGARDRWLACEQILRIALHDEKLPFYEAPGEAAFYGPKIDVQMQLSSSGNEESIASLQLDFISGERFDLSFIDSKGVAQRPYVIHRAPLGSHERFVALLIEYYEGRLPGWLAPVQVALIPANEQLHSACEKICADLLASEIRAHLSNAGGSLAKRIRDAHQSRPFSKIVVGDKELASGEYKLQFRDEEFALSLVDLKLKLKEKCQVPS